MGTVLNILTGVIGVGAIGSILNVLLKRFLPKSKFDVWKGVVRKAGESVGVLITLGMSRLLKGLWNKVFEPYVIMLFELLGKSFIDGIVSGMETDNESFKKE